MRKSWSQLTCLCFPQTNLTWLDLSFNKIPKIEGLDTLTKLVDLSLFNNEIQEIENLDKLTQLNVLSIGEYAYILIYIYIQQACTCFSVAPLQQ